MAFNWHSMHYKCIHFCIFGQCNNNPFDDTDYHQAIRVSWLESSTGVAIHHTKYQYRWIDYVDWASTESIDHRQSLYCSAQYHISNIHHASMYGCSVGYHSNDYPSSYSAQ